MAALDGSCGRRRCLLSGPLRVSASMTRFVSRRPHDAIESVVGGATRASPTWVLSSTSTSSPARSRLLAECTVESTKAQPQLAKTSAARHASRLQQRARSSSSMSQAQQGNRVRSLRRGRRMSRWRSSPRRVSRSTTHRRHRFADTRLAMVLRGVRCANRFRHKFGAFETYMS